MGIIFGFGRNEEEVKNIVYKDIKKIVKAVIEENNKNGKVEYFSQIINSIKEKISEYEQKILKKYTRIEEKPIEERPKRYFNILVRSIEGSCCYLFILVEFTFINTRHPLSQDGIAAFYDEECWHFKLDEDI